jgi:hypothetical protein
MRNARSARVGGTVFEKGSQHWLALRVAGEGSLGDGTSLLVLGDRVFGRERRRLGVGLVIQKKADNDCYRRVGVLTFWDNGFNGNSERHVVRLV